MFSRHIFFLSPKILKSLTLKVFLFVLTCILVSGFSAAQTNDQVTSQLEWVGTWTTSPQLVEPRNNPPAPGLSNNTLRQVIRVSLGGETLRVKFTNEFSTSPVTMNEVHITLSTGSGSIDEETDMALSFNGNTNITMEPGGTVMSDPFTFSVPPLTDLAVTIFFGETSPDVSGHPGSRTTSYILEGNEISKPDFTNAVTTDHWYAINTIDVMAPQSAAAVAVMGNSITDGRGSGTNKQNRWTDILAQRLQSNPATKQVAVLNTGIGGNCVCRDCLGPAALRRFERDILQQSKVKWLIILEGVNDIGGSPPDKSDEVADNLINAYQEMITKSHNNGILVYGATIMPFGTSFYDSEEHRAAWNKVNSWIRNSGEFDAVIDLAKEMAKDDDPAVLKEEGDTGDHLHPNEAGHKMMAEAVDLSLFTGNK